LPKERGRIRTFHPRRVHSVSMARSGGREGVWGVGKEKHGVVRGNREKEKGWEKGKTTHLKVLRGNLVVREGEKVWSG